MKKTFMILGGVFVVLIVAAAIGIGIVAVKGSALDKESKAYVDRVVPIICADLNADTLSKYASKELLASATPEEFEKIFTWLKKLGAFKQFKESSGQANMSYTTQNGKSITGRYVAQVEFEAGPAQVNIVTVKTGDEWKVQMFRINSSALMK
jgi:hypothetical protein